MITDLCDLCFETAGVGKDRWDDSEFAILGDKKILYWGMDNLFSFFSVGETFEEEYDEIPDL